MDGRPLQQSLGANLWRMTHDPVIAVGLALFVVAGMCVGVGLQYRHEEDRFAGA